MANPVNCGVSDGKNLLSFEVTASELKGLKKGNFSFVIQPAEGGMEQAVFSAVAPDGRLLRQNTSEPFPQGGISKRSEDLTKAAYNVTVKKHQDGLDLNDYF